MSRAIPPIDAQTHGDGVPPSRQFEPYAALTTSIWMPVRGDSMVPLLRPGDQVLVDFARRWACGDVVVVGARRGLVVHRIVAVADDGNDARVITKGDAVDHCDRAVCGAAIVGVVIRMRRRRWWGGWQVIGVRHALGHA